MSDDSSDAVHRRDFMVSSLATVGVSGALMPIAGIADASAAAPPADAPQGTVYTGDVIQRKRAVSALDVDDLILQPGLMC